MSRCRALALLLIGACGDDRDIGVDAPAVDAGPTAQLVKVRYIAPPEVADQATVIFQYESSTIATVTSTDRAGVATARMSGPGSVTVYVNHGGSYFIYTYMGVQPGDEVVVDDRINADLHSFRRFTIEIPAVPDGSFYNLSTSCGEENVSTAVNTPQQVGAFNSMVDCPTTMDMLVMGFGLGTYYTFSPDIPVVDGSFVRIPGPYHPLDLNSVEVVGADDANGSSVQLRTGTLGDQRVRQSLLAEVFDNVFVDNGNASALFETPVPPNATRMYDVLALAVGPGVPHLASWGPGTTEITLDLGRDMPRDYLTMPVYSVAANTITWTEPETGRLADAAFAVIEWDASGTNYQWHIQAPRSEEARLVLPTLPEALYPHGNVRPLTALANVATDRGLDGIGKNLLGSWFPGSLWPADTASGEVRYREIGSPLLPPD